MSLKLGDAKTGNPPVVVKPGTYAARCYSVVDLGTHVETGRYGRKVNRKLRFSFELPDETHVFDEDQGPQPLSVHREYNFVMGEKSNLQIDLQRWRNKDFTADELQNFEVANVLGKPCLVSVENKAAQSSGNIYAKVSAIASLPKSFGQLKPAVNKQVYYDVTMGQNDVFNSLPQFIQERIVECQEWTGSAENENQDTQDDNFLGGIDKAEPIKASNEDDDIPF